MPLLHEIQPDEHALISPLPTQKAIIEEMSVPRAARSVRQKAPISRSFEVAGPGTEWITDMGRLQKRLLRGAWRLV